MANEDSVTGLSQLVELDQLPHQHLIVHKKEDWSGITCPRERRRLQNRLNQRARTYNTFTGPTGAPWPMIGFANILRSPGRVKIQKTTATRRVLIAQTQCFEGIIRDHVDTTVSRLHVFAVQALRSYSAGQPCADHLLTVLHLNFIRSMTANASALGLRVEWLNCTSVSPLGMIGPNDQLTATCPSSCPSNLIPTALQREIPHHPWIDLFPLARLRDNFLLATSNLLSGEDEIRLWNDVVEAKSPGSDWTGLITWGDPWASNNWEVTELFLENWCWLLEGCDELAQSTNRWRQRRGEPPLRFRNWATLQSSTYRNNLTAF